MWCSVRIPKRITCENTHDKEMLYEPLSVSSDGDKVGFLSSLEEENFARETQDWEAIFMSSLIGGIIELFF